MYRSFCHTFINFDFFRLDMVYNLLFSLIIGSLAGWKLTNTNNTLETNIQRIQGRRNRGAWGPAPPSFAKCPFSGSKVPFSCVKNVIKIAFFAERTLLKTWIYVICGKWFSFSGKISYIRKFFCYIRKMFSYLGKNVIYAENFFGMSGKFLWDELLPPPPSPTFAGKKF
jgi:hypothetical protein